MIRQLFIAIGVGAALSLSAPQATRAQSSTTFGSNGGAVIPSGNTKKEPPNAAAGAPGSQPNTSLDDRSGSGAAPATREGDTRNQMADLAPVALLMFLVFAGGLYWFVFRKPTTPEGEAAAKGGPVR